MKKRIYCNYFYIFLLMKESSIEHKRKTTEIKYVNNVYIVLNTLLISLKICTLRTLTMDTELLNTLLLIHNTHPYLDKLFYVFTACRFSLNVVSSAHQTGARTETHIESTVWLRQFDGILHRGVNCSKCAVQTKMICLAINFLTRVV